MSSENISNAYPDLPLNKLTSIIEADKMAGEIEEMLDAEAEIYSMDVPDEVNFNVFIDAVWSEYDFGKIDCLEAVEKIMDYGRLKLVK